MLVVASHSLPCLVSFETQDVGQTVEDENGHSKDRPQDRTNPSSFLYQFMALLKKRLLTFGRDKKMWAFVVFMPFVFVGIGTLLIINFGVKDQPALALSPQVRVEGRTRSAKG